MMKVSKFSNDLTDANLHTSGFGQVAGGKFGQTTNETFSDRYKRDRERKLVGSYHQSLLAGAYNRQPIPVSVPKRSTSASDAAPINPRAEPINVKKPNVPSPPPRNYNPYK